MEEQLKSDTVRASYININDEEQAEHWCSYLGLTKMELIGEIIAVGKSSLAIKKHLERIRSANLEREKIGNYRASLACSHRKFTREIRSRIQNQD